MERAKVWRLIGSMGWSRNGMGQPPLGTAGRGASGGWGSAPGTWRRQAVPEVVADQRLADGQFLGQVGGSEAGGRVGVCPGLYDDPHRRSLTSGDHSSSRLAPSDPYPVVPLTNLTVIDNPNDWCLRAQSRSDRHH